MQTTKSNKFLLILLALTVLVTLWTAMNDPSETDELSEPSIALVQSAKANINNNPTTPIDPTKESVKATRNPPAVKDSLDSEPTVDFPWQALERTASTENIQDVFKPHSWLVVVPQPPAPPAPPPEPPPPPTAPPVPFQYVGKMENSPNAGKIFLLHNKQFYYVSVGENINQDWRLDKEETNVLRLTYLPLDLPQVLHKSSKRKVAATQDVANEQANEINQ